MPSAFKFIKDGSYTKRDVFGVKSARRVAQLTAFEPDDSDMMLDEAIGHAVSEHTAPTFGTLFPGDSQAVVTEVTSAIADGSIVALVYDYERPTGGATAGGDLNRLYCVAEDITTVTVERVKLPHVNEGEPITVGYENPDNDKQKIAPQVAKVRLQKPALQVTFVGTFNGRPTYEEEGETKIIGSTAGKVNSAAFRGLARGYWLVAGVRVRRQPKQKRRVLEVVIISLLDEDWGEYVVVEHPSGLVPKIDTAGMDDYPTEDDLYFLPTGDDYLKSGVVKIAPYPEVDYDAAFASIDDTNEDLEPVDEP